MAKTIRLLVGTKKGLFELESDESRREWRLLEPRLLGWEVGSLLVDDRGPVRLLAGTSSYVYGPTVRYSDDRGQTWVQAESSPAYSEASGFKLNSIWQLALGHSSEPGRLYAGVDEAGLFVSDDRGNTWTEVDALTRHPTRSKWFPGAGGLCLHTILVDPGDPKRIWVAASAVGVFRTDDGGLTWVTRNVGLPGVATGSEASEIDRCVHKMVMDPARRGVLYQQFHGGVFRSHDAGDTWEPITEGLPSDFGFPMVVTKNGDLFVIPLVSDEVRMVGKGALRVFRSKNRGDSWAPSGTGLPDDAYVGVLRDAMAVDPLDPSGIYFGTTMGELYASPDGGDEWIRLPGEYPRIMSVRAWVDEG